MSLLVTFAKLKIINNENTGKYASMAGRFIIYILRSGKSEWSFGIEL